MNSCCTSPLFRRAGASMAMALAVLTATSAQAAIPAGQRQFLVDFYHHTNGPAWNVSNNWLGAPGTECTWIGVTCDAGENTVTALSVQSNNLTDPVGALLPDWSALPDIRTINLSDNQLAGRLPPISGLPELRSLDVSHNDLQGTLPSPSGLTHFFRYHAHNNQFTGLLPALPPTLEQLRVENNQLTGPVPAPPAALVASASALCPNQLTPSASAAWDTATGSTPWHATCSAPPAATPVPTLSEWALILLALGAATVGMGALRRKQF
ncbi:IPTL-CTERM sorting domain-containing protein [Acidovorax sp. Root267]|uniref:IPTL-CTERM sorting domain-containing protein n=1 Tax=Acidovorax sp. Root267 TaxID=1736505 RepID=UPI0009E9E008|nr:IPTL-CTERM sorting domain-containing protein [Acidovorax sp. Root267]